MSNTRPADPRAAHVKRFCASIVPDATPISMAINPELGCEALDCFGNVRRKILKSGGSISYGWSIWEWPGVFIEAEHHAVYREEEGRLIDLTPPSDNMTRSRTFLADSSAVYDFQNEGQRRDNHRLALTDDPLIAEFFQTASAFNEIMSSIPGVGEVAVDVATARKLQAVQIENNRLLLKLLMKYTPKGAPCFCGSGLKFKRCHGQNEGS